MNVPQMLRVPHWYQVLVTPGGVRYTGKSAALMKSSSAAAPAATYACTRPMDCTQRVTLRIVSHLTRRASD